MDDFYRSWRDQSLKAWVDFITPVIESDGFVKTLKAWSEPMLAAQVAVRRSTALTLELFELPTRSRLAELSYQVQTAERRCLAAEERAEALVSDMQRIEQSLVNKKKENKETRR